MPDLDQIKQPEQGAWDRRGTDPWACNDPDRPIAETIILSIVFRL